MFRGPVDSHEERAVLGKQKIVAAEEELNRKSDQQQGVSVHAEEGHVRPGQIRQDQAGFSAARGFRLSVGECGSEKAQKGRSGRI